MPSHRGATQIDVSVPPKPYRVTIGDNLLEELGELVSIPDHAQRAVVLSSAVPLARYAPRVAHGLTALGLQVEVLELPDGEAAKTISTLERCLRSFAKLTLGRKDFVVAVGGGAVCDLGGFAAAIWNRGIDVIHCPTTLLAQVDAAIGGKTAVNLPEGKNLVGAFHQPIAVLIDIATLNTLPDRQRRAGLAEIVKYGFIADTSILKLVEESPTEVSRGESNLTTELISRSVVVKAKVVSSDERESGLREILNYGHTVGHAIEAMGEYQSYEHGEAVALGMVFAARLGERLGITEAGLADRTVNILQALGLPTGGLSLPTEKIWDLLRRDKKARAGVRFVVCPRAGDAVVIEQPDPAVINDILASLS